MVSRSAVLTLCALSFAASPGEQLRAQSPYEHQGLRAGMSIVDAQSKVSPALAGQWGACIRNAADRFVNCVTSGSDVVYSEFDIVEKCVYRLSFKWLDAKEGQALKPALIAAWGRPHLELPSG